MLFTVVAPEFILGKAIGDFILVRKLKKKVDKMKTDGVIKAHEEWGLSHGFFSLMGGFRALEHDDSEEMRPTQCRESTPTGKNHGGKPEHMRVDVLRATEGQDPHMMKSKNIQDQSVQTSPERDVSGITGSTILPPEILLSLRKQGRISRLPNITEEEIHDKSKANAFVKALAAVQIFWVCVQVIVRIARGLAISQLELMVTAFSICATVTYVFLISKPQGVQVPMRPILIPQGSLRSDLGGIDISDLSPRTRWLPLRNLFTPGIGVSTDFNLGEVEVVPNDSIPGKQKDWGIYALGMSVGGIIFGGIHVGGWNLSFPTPVEQELWRIASVIMTCLLPITFLPYILLIFDKHPWAGDGATQVWTFIFGVIYIIARLFLLVETFRTLGFLPPDAFVATWVSSLPSVD
jgi:hypothetical protein